MWQQYWWIILVGILIVPLICITAFAFWLRSRDDINLETGVKCWDVFVKLISALTIVVSGAMVFGKYIDQQKTLEGDRIQQQRKELSLKKAEFLRQKLQLDNEHYETAKKRFEEVTSLAARLATTNPTDKERLARFNEMYYAALIGVEKHNGPVEQAMVAFRSKLLGLSTEDKSLEQLTLRLSRACETELKESQDSIIEQYRQITEMVTSGNPN